MVRAEQKLRTKPIANKRADGVNHQLRAKLKKTKRWVVKLGSALLTNDGCGLRSDDLHIWADQIHLLRQQGYEIILVSSGATAEGIVRLGWGRRPQLLYQVQAAAAVGQTGLINAWATAFQIHNIQTAQILLTHGEIKNRKRYLNARSTLRTLLRLGVIPIVNENDTVSTEELKFGDNDTLAGLVTHLVDADLLVLLTDQQGLYKADPRFHPDAELVRIATAGDKNLQHYASVGSSLGQGGMVTKLEAASMVAKSGVSTIIAAGLEKNILQKIANGEDYGTFLVSDKETLTARKQWLVSQCKTHGKLRLDKGAVDALSQHNKSLLAVGVIGVAGDFERGEIVSCVDPHGREIARGLVNYDVKEMHKIMGHNSDQFERLLGYIDAESIIHRDDLILL